MGMVVREVWASNLSGEMQVMKSLIHKFPIVAVDFEYPGCLKNTPRFSSEAQRYGDMVSNVNSLKPIQLGLTLCDRQANIGGVWQVNFKFDLDVDLHVKESIQLLSTNGVEFDKLKREGIDVFRFMLMFKEMMGSWRGSNDDIQWVTFHGLYDLGYLLQLASGRRLPESEVVFIRALGDVFGCVYDLKYMARFCEGLMGGELGLDRMANILKVQRVGHSHQAGSDSFVTACAFFKMKEVYKLNERLHQGFLYGIESKIESRVVRRRQPVLMVPVPAYYSRQFPACVRTGYGGAVPVMMKVPYFGQPVVQYRPVLLG